MVLVRDVMTRDPISIPENALVDAALELIVTQNVSGLPVVDDEGRLVGLITEFDLLSLVEQSDAESQARRPCRDFMQVRIRTISQHASLDVATAVLLGSTVRRLLVVDGERFVGILSRRDVLRAIRDRRVRLTRARLSGSRSPRSDESDATSLRS